MRVAITGATGFIGRAIIAALQRRGDEVIALTRAPSEAHMPSGVSVEQFDVNDSTPNPRALAGADAVVHLSGETVDGRWTPAKKRSIFDSRVAGTRNLVASLAAMDHRPRVLVSASATGYYGNRGDDVLDDYSPPGNDFLAGVCVAWEREAQAAAKIGIRVASVRTPVVFGSGGALTKLIPIFRLGIGGPIGSGRQWMPWIHIDDLADFYCFLIDRQDMTGPIAPVAPDYATNARVMQGLGAALGRPALAAAPGIALKIVLGEFAETLLGGQLILPRRATDSGFTWRQPELEAALRDVVAPNARRKPSAQTFESEQFVKAPIEKVFGFFSEPSNLEKITAPAMRLRTTPASTELRQGVTFDYAFHAWGMNLRCRALIVEWDRDKRFADVQVRGPYLWWRHTHEFDQKNGGVMVRDRLEYALPFAPLSNVMLPAVRRDIENAFTYRRRAIEDIFAV